MNKQSLQKFTDFEQIDKLPKEELKNTFTTLDEATPYIKYLLVAVQGDGPIAKDKSLKKLISILKAVGEGGQAKTIKRQDYESNNSKIKMYIHNWALTNENFPPLSLIADEVNLSRTTVYKHLSKTDKSNTEINRNIRDTMRDEAMDILFKIGVKNEDAKALGMFVKLAEPKEDKTAKQTINNNYLTINNFRISQNNIEALPNSAQEEIQRIIKANLINI